MSLPDLDRVPASSDAHEAAHPTVLDGYLEPQEVAHQLGVSVRTLTRWHALRCGPPRCMTGRKIYYRVDAVREWLRDSERGAMRPHKRGR